MADDRSLHAVLESARKELLDLTTRNRLISTSRTTSRSTRLEIVGESSEQVFQRLVADGKTMSFLPRPESRESEDAELDGSEVGDGELTLAQPTGDGEREGAAAARQLDHKLQTKLDSEHLQKRLLKLFYDARTYEEEQGVNILYLALGFLKWYEDPKSDRERFAPLILIPVTLNRQSATSRFKVGYNDEELATNLSLQARIKDDFGIELPELPDPDDLSPTAYFSDVSRAIAQQSRWEVLPNDMVLWFFSFSKFLMYRDLHPENWPPGRSLGANPILRGLLHESFSADPPLCGDDDKIDQLVSPQKAVHVVDADSSQAVAIEEVTRGRNLVIQGPPGTGKSQTIANLIAAAVVNGKSVLFVAEKMAALDVVHRRLANIGLGDMCLELHSNKANKKAVLQDLEAALALRKPSVGDVPQHCRELTACQDQLNRHLDIIHGPLPPSGFTPFQVVGELVRLRAAGARPPSFRLQNPELWTRADLDERLSLLRDLADQVERLGQPNRHPWRGSQLDIVLPTDVDRITLQVREAAARTRQLIEAGAELAKLLHVAPPETVFHASQVALLAQHLAKAPQMDRAALGSKSWEEQRPRINALIETGQTYAQCRAALKDVVVDTAWNAELALVRRDLATYGRSWLRFLRRPYRHAQAALRGILVDRPPKAIDDRLKLVDTLLRGQQARKSLDDSAASQLGAESFGASWAGPDSDWTALQAISDWEDGCRVARLPADFRDVIARLRSGESIAPLLKRMGEALPPCLASLQQLFELLELDLPAAFGAPEPTRIPLADVFERLRQWEASPESLSRWVAYSTRRRKLEAEGLRELSDEIDCGEVQPKEAVARCEVAFYESLIRMVFAENSELASFNGASHEKLLRKFRELDAERIELARYEVARRHYDRLPKSDSAIGGVGLVKRELQKKRRHLPIRRLLVEAGRAVQAIKPVFMMSPISVAQYLAPGATDFDLLLIDEASQIQPVDALGAIARAGQIVVVGDSRQLPPTSFFNRMLGERDDDADDAALQTGDLESILGLCCAQNVPQRLLRWHYRSRHHSLIAVSNREFYDNRLYVIPSPSGPSPEQGLVFHFVEDGVFDRGGTRANRVEARAVAEAVMAHARQRPEVSLGVGAFSVAQRDAILDELELLRRSETSLESFFVTGGAEPFFVKNLENIQGDERDVIFISVGYGKNPEGYMAMSFGPLSNDGGERRLNVLITRSRDCCRVFSSIKSDDIDTSRAKARGAQALKTFLKYAELGIIDADTGHTADHESEFERQVAAALARHGWETRAQVGVAGFFVDLAVVDPECPGRYLLGIECDGANYHRSRSARDRDRIRQAVLESRGWAIHRIWSTDWFHRPAEELKKALAATEQAGRQLAGRGLRRPPSKSAAAEPVALARVDETSAESQGNGVASQPYKVAAFRIANDAHIHKMPVRDLASVVSKIIRLEGPIHREEISRRVTQLWGLTRTGKRARDAVEKAMPLVDAKKDIFVEGEFYCAASGNDVPIRDRSQVESTSLRKPEMLPPLEVRKAINAIVEVHHGAQHDEIVVEAGRLFGFKSTSAQLRSVIETELQALLKSHALEETNGKLYATGADSGKPMENV